MTPLARPACPLPVAAGGGCRAVRAALLACLLVAAATASGHGLAAVETSRFRQAVALEHGEGVVQDQVRARALYCAEARAGNVEAAFSLGWMYANGRGGDRSDEAAAALFAMAAAAGHRQAANLMRVFGGSKPRKPGCLNGRGGFKLRSAGSGDWHFSHYLAQRAPWQRPHARLINRLAPEFGIQPRLALAIAEIESDFDPAARSPRDAVGLMQLIVPTAERFGVRDRTDPEQNVRGGLAYLRWLMAYFRGRVALVVAAYNAGEEAVAKYRGVPPFPETRRYVERVRALYPIERHGFDTAAAADGAASMPEPSRRDRGRRTR